VTLLLKNDFDVIYEQQRFLPIIGWTGTFAEGWQWVSDAKGQKQSASPQDLKLPAGTGNAKN
jgi:hypothetical protein